MKKFSGFLPETIDFLWELRLNNNKEFMEANRERYRAVLKEPFDALAAELAEQSPVFGGGRMKCSISRINRDIRFSRDKSPYRACRWVTVFDERLKGTEWKERPTFYFELTPEGFRHGLGLWHASPAYLTAYRKKIEAEPAGFDRLVGRIERDPLFRAVGEEYKKIRNESLPAAVQEWYRRKGVHIFAEGGMEEVLFSAELAEYLAGEWKRLGEMYEFLNDVEGR